ncbi:sorting nexin-29-like, partial [Penaeus indicus]|uniref:sorting nexin-29-like n=1 Tax=Penaeus indicus TaxID=29960 RepID=UPI00300D5527
MFSQRLQRERREAAISASLITRLKEAVQSVLQPGAGGGVSDVRGPMKGNLGAIVGHSDNTNNLCNVIEAILIHGLRDSLGERMSALLGADPDRMPVPNFWPVIMIISHRDLMEQVGDLSFITSEVGRSRAWVRLALNQGQICSYLSVLLQDNRTLKDYYRTTAVFRDPERADIILRVLQPISALTFNLATNAAVLNTWTQTPLILAGLWAPSVQSVVSDPVLAATDVASTVMDERTEGMNIPIVETPVSDQMFDMIFGGTPETSFISNMESRESKDTKVQESDTLQAEEKDRLNSLGSRREERAATEDKRDSALETTDSDLQASQGQGKNPRVEVQSPLEESQKQHSRDHSFTNSSECRDYHRTYSTDSSMSRSVIDGAPEYDQLFLDITAVSPFASVPGLSLSDVDPASSSSTPSREASHESSHSDEAEKLNYEVLSQQIPSDA